MIQNNRRLLMLRRSRLLCWLLCNLAVLAKSKLTQKSVLRFSCKEDAESISLSWVAFLTCRSSPVIQQPLHVALCSQPLETSSAESEKTSRRQWTKRNRVTASSGQACSWPVQVPTKSTSSTSHHQMSRLQQRQKPSLRIMQCSSVGVMMKLRKSV